MNIADWCLRNSRTTLVILAMLTFGGVLTYQRLPKGENPDFTVRTAVVRTMFPGASPQKVEELVTSKIEEKIRELGDVEDIVSQSLAGQSLITVILYESTPKQKVRPIWEQLRYKVEEAAAELPDGAQPPMVIDDKGDVFGMVIALRGDGYTFRELKDRADDIKDELLRLPNIAKVELFGAQEERVFVEYRNATFAERGVSPFLLQQAIQSQNRIVSSGSATVGSERVQLESSGGYNSVEDIGRTSIQYTGQPQAVELRDIADVRRGFVDPPSPMARVNGESAIVIAIHMSKTGNVIDVGADVDRRVREIGAALPIGLDLDVVMWEPRFVSRKVNDFMINLLEAFGFVFIVMLITTGLRTGLIASSLIPLAILICFSCMPIFNIGIQQISLASLIIALGIMVDNGVVVSENILVRLTKGEDRREAAVSAVRELWKPLLAASLTTIWAFLPIGAAKSNVGEFCLSLYQVITITLLASWLVSITIVPMLCSWFIKVEVKGQSYDGPFYRAYRGILLFSLRQRALFVILTIIVTLGGGVLFGSVKQMFFPPNEREITLVDFWLPYGTDIETTSQRAAEFEKFLLAQEETERVTAYVGNGGPMWNLSFSPEEYNPNYAFILVELKGGKEGIQKVDGLIAKGRKYLEDHLPSGRISLKKLENGPAVGDAIQVRLSGDRMDELYRLRNEIEKIVADTPGVINPRDDWGEWTKKLDIEINQDKVKRAGLTSDDVAQSLQTQFSGLPAGDYREGDEIIPIMIRSDEAGRSDISRLEGMNVYSTRTGGSVPLLQVARPELTWQPANIRRRNTKRTMTLKAGLLPGHFATDALAIIQPRINELMASDKWIAGYRVEYGGEQENSAKAQASIAAGMPLAMGLLFLTLVSMFNSIRRPIIIGLTIPPMIFGIASGLLITDAAFGFMALLGMLSLMGIVVNNAIMMIDSIENLRDRGMEAANAIVASGLSRMRPILTTATTTVIGLIPLSLQGGEMWRPMANLLIFGLSFATLLTLVLCPVLYSLFYRVRFRDFEWKANVLKDAD